MSWGDEKEGTVVETVLAKKDFKFEKNYLYKSIVEE